MNLDFSDDQKFLQDEARKFFDKEGGLTNTRKVMDDSLSHDEALWGKVLELGWTGIRIPEEYDGLGLGHLELCVIAEEIGRALAPIPFSSSVYFAIVISVWLTVAIIMVSLVSYLIFLQGIMDNSSLPCLTFIKAFA